MFKILKKTQLAPQVFYYLLHAPDIAKKALPGQFVIIRLDETGERIPITISDFDPIDGTLTFYVQAVGKTSLEMSLMHAGDFILDVVGPLGNSSQIDLFGTVALVGGGFGIAAIHPIARALTQAGNKTISILGARTEELVILEKEMRTASTDVHVVTDDGSHGAIGLVTDILQILIDKKEPINRVIAIGPLIMMKAVADLTRPHKIPTFLSMNPIMIDGTGMCGACRVTVNGEMKFACVDGPEFDGHAVDFEGLLNRLKTYIPEETEAKEKYLKDTAGKCRIAEVSQIYG
ncbi:MAG: sulfide/dihydroorotate dehydrogenase-like FAD/NAD-binding protein [Nitrospina sp.]|jgi:ferredoxin--NADP+ reductase|nr:sulfide/dihydroorotate dehydrogenase-like FAD/NAD-binding protein [Nitrospina sp.]MBT3507963.1 sulfide/dihydroorotate dehydrogenase-like FAD/NAD-binding protein [Nitrospina sp.]MBT3876490.1 sulfide/dihydroorotate dehydrogenase-like FAD/NAD-binding protein [Nitrospina sp.]MBT4048690.1 sulfide/dihydroorotate dehydrogenase-like FAD/NAD-binding protein [Nitrospina sp.]MBT4556921.1 sulfide/dihydroorotate dehydrogenase-like FAD/NAD-binding protein [Nitrospina sp.]